MRVLLLFAIALPLFAQEEVNLDWSTKTVIKSPTTIEPPVPLKITVQNVNDFLYSYRGSIKVDPTSDPPVDLSQIGRLFSTPDCTAITDAAKKLKAGLDKDFRLTKVDGTYPSVALADSQKAWNAIRAFYITLKAASPAQQQCADWKTYSQADQPLASELAKADAGPHQYSFTATLSANGTVTVTIAEYYDKEPTKNGSTDFSFLANSNQFFLSVGFLATEVQARSYDVVDVGVTPGTPAIPATATTPAVPAVPDVTNKQLRIQGTGKFRPAGMVLLNYKIPWKPLLGHNFGAALSAGMVYRSAPSGGDATTTNFGVFAGGSIHLWERFWITPGVHIGEFSDLPKGFSAANGYTVPNGYPSSFSGTNRWTTRFAIGITFRAADFKAATALTSNRSTGTGTSNDASAAGAAKPAASTPPATAATPDPAAPTDPLLTSLDQLNAAITKAQSDLTTATTAQTAAKAAFTAASTAASDAQKVLDLKTAATTAAVTGKQTKDDAVTTARTKLAAAAPADKDTAEKALKDAETTASDAAVALGKAQTEQAAAATALQARSDEKTAAGNQLSTATAAVAAAQKTLSDLQTTQQAACAKIAACK